MLDLHGYIDFILSNSALKGLSLIVLSIVSAKFVDMVFTFIFKRLVSSTKTTLDDRILQLLHKPIFYSILFVGFILSIKTIHLPEYIEFGFIGLLKTITIIIWLFVVSKILVMSVSWVSKKTKSTILQKKPILFFM